MNVAYQVVAEQLVPLPLGHLAGEALATARTVIDSLLQVSNLDSSNVLGVGVGVPGPIDAGRGKVVEGTILPEWEGIDLRSLHRDFEYPVIFDNDANLGALAEHLWGPHRDAEHLMFVKVGSGIGAGLILGGKRYAGSTGITGEIGHTVISDHGKPCQCGKRGCLETVASLSSLIETLSPNAHHPVTVDDIVRRALGADPPTMRAVTTAGVAIGHALGNVINLISPQVIVIGGPLVGLGELLMTPIHAGIAERALGTLVPSTDLSFAALGDHAEAMGAAALVLQGALVS